MTPLCALVVEDEWPARNYLVELLRDTGRVGQISAVTTVDEARQVLDTAGLRIDVIFVDIRLVDRPGDVSGLHFARELAGRPDGPGIVLATASPEHALSGFELGAVDYLLKPFSLERVQTCIGRIEQQRPPRPDGPPQSLVARKRSGLVFLDLDGIYAFEASNRLTYVHHVEGTFLVDLSLGALSAALGNRVVRVHRSWVVARAHVREFGRREGDPSLQLSDGRWIPVSRDRAKEVRAQMLDGTIGLR